MALLAYQRQFESGLRPSTYEEIFDRLKFPRGNNLPQAMSRILRKLYGLGILREQDVSNSHVRNGMRGLALSPKLKIEFRVEGVLANEAMLRAEGRFESLVPDMPTFAHAEDAWFDVVQKLTETEVNYRRGSHEMAFEAVSHAQVRLGDELSGRLQVLMLLNKLRIYRRLEKWHELEQELIRTKSSLGNDKLEARTREIADALHLIYTTWLQYESAGTASLAELRQLVVRMNNAVLSSAIHLNTVLAAEQRSLLALIHRRLAQRYFKDGEPQKAQQHVSTALAYNAEAMEFACLNSDMTQMCNASANRHLMLCDQLIMAVRGGHAHTLEEWEGCIRWLALSHRVGVEAAVGMDNLWTPCYLLVNYRYATEANIPWTKLIDAARKVSEGIAATQSHPIAMAFDLAEPLLSRIFALAQRDQSGYARQLIVFAGEIAFAALRDGIDFSNEDHRLVQLGEAIDAISAAQLRTIPDSQKRIADFRRWRTAGAN